MFFQTNLNGKTWKVDVHEHRHHWEVTLKPEGGGLEIHKIPKANYRRMDDAISFLFDNTSYMIDAIGDGVEYAVYTRGSYRMIRLLNDQGLLHESLKKGTQLTGSKILYAGMPGKIVDVLVSDGQPVKLKQPLLIMEAMKMENEMRATQDAVVKSVRVTKGQSVDTGAVLIEFE